MGCPSARSRCWMSAGRSWTPPRPTRCPTLRCCVLQQQQQACSAIGAGCGCPCVAGMPQLRALAPRQHQHPTHSMHMPVACSTHAGMQPTVPARRGATALSRPRACQRGVRACVLCMHLCCSPAAALHLTCTHLSTSQTAALPSRHRWPASPRTHATYVHVTACGSPHQ